MDQPEYARAAETMLTKERISALGESIASQLKFEPCGDIAATIGKIGGKIKVEDTLLTDPERAGSLFVDGKNDFTIIVPAHTSPFRDRFTIAHELGHFIVHYLWKLNSGAHVPPKMMAYRKDSDRVEWEANWFAAAFLMPSARFREQYAQDAGNLSKVASAFCVSESAARIRARSLGLA